MVYTISGWWLTYPSEKYEFVSWDDYSQLNGKIKFMFQTTNQQMILILFGFPHDGFYHSYNPIITLQGAGVLPPSYKLVYNILQPPASIDTDLSWYICHKPKLPSGKLT